MDWTCVNFQTTTNGDNARTRASDFKHLPAVILSIFIVNILGRFMFNIGLSTEKNKFYHGFTRIIFNEYHQMFC